MRINSTFSNRHHSRRHHHRHRGSRRSLLLLHKARESQYGSYLGGKRSCRSSKSKSLHSVHGWMDRKMEPAQVSIIRSSTERNSISRATGRNTSIHQQEFVITNEQTHLLETSHLSIKSYFQSNLQNRRKSAFRSSQGSPRPPQGNTSEHIQSNKNQISPPRPP